jgi:hypothetical protein
VDVAALRAETTDWRSGMGYEGLTIPATEDSPAIDIYIGPDADVLAVAPPKPGPYMELTDGTIVPLYAVDEPEEATVDGRPATLQQVRPATDEELADQDHSLEGTRYSDLEGFIGDGHGWVMAWQPIDGVHAIVQVRGDDRAAAYAAAATLELDRAQRCAVPMRLDAVPEGTQWTECRTSVRHDRAGDIVAWSLSSLTLSPLDGDPISIYAEDVKQAYHPADPPIEPDRTVAGYPAAWIADPEGLLVLDLDGASVFIEGTTAEQAGRLVEQLRRVGELNRPGTWPDRAVG